MNDTKLAQRIIIMLLEAKIKKATYQQMTKSYNEEWNGLVSEYTSGYRAAVNQIELCIKELYEEIEE